MVERVLADSLADMHLCVRLIGMFAGLAVLLAVSGVYAVLTAVGLAAWLVVPALRAMRVDPHIALQYE